jgi:hypothetical protein
VYNWTNTGETFDLWFAESGTEMPSEFGLHGAYPNPFNPITTITYTLPEAKHVKLTFYDLQGRKVAALIDGIRASGKHELTFDGSRFSSGLYVCRLESGNLTDSKKMVLMK